MNPREKLLTMVISACVALLLGYWGVSSVWGWFDARDTRIETLRRDLKKKKDELTRVQIAAQRLAQYESQSLPREVEVAQSLYQTWLLNTATEAKLSDVNIVTLKPRANQRTYHALGFTVAARGTLPQMVDWLYHLQSEDRLQRIDSFSLKPIKNSKDLTLSMGLSAIAVNSAPQATTLKPQPRSEWPSLASFQEPILNRNLFGPPNQSPRFDSAAPPTAYLGKSWEYAVKATDADSLDHVTYQLAKSSNADAKFDSTSGRFRWTPASKGEFEFEITATDDGWPARSTNKKLKVVVTDPPPPPPLVVEGPKKLAFDAAKYAVLTAVLAVNETPEAWLHNRVSGEVQKLHPGDSFTIGSINGKVLVIEGETVDFESEGKLRRLVKGIVLSEAVLIESNAPPFPDGN